MPELGAQKYAEINGYYASTGDLTTEARARAASLGIIGCGFQAETQLACIRAAVPTIEHVVAYCRTEATLEDFCARVGAEAAESHREAAAESDEHRSAPRRRILAA